MSISSCAFESVELFPACEFVVEGPRSLDGRAQLHEGVYPPLRAHRVRNVRVNPYVPVTVNERAMLTAEYYLENQNRISANPGPLGINTERLKLANVRETKKIERGILINAPGAHNWYHFLIEVMPKVFLAEQLPREFDEYPLLICQEVERLESFATVFSLFKGTRNVHTLSPSDIALVYDAVLVDDIQLAPPNMIANHWPRLADWKIHSSLFRKYSREVRLRLLGESASSDRANKRLYLRRPDNSRAYNQKELMAVASHFGFEPIDLGNLLLLDQAKAFSKVSAVIGPGGAAWSGMIFNAGNLRGLSWMPEELRGASSFSSIAALLGHDLRYMESRYEGKLRSAYDTHRTAYRVDPKALESALSVLIKSA